MIISNKYAVLEELGRGGMGIVYRVRHLDLGTVYALKVLRGPVEDGLLGRFHQEARVMARLRHPHIIRVFDIDHDRDHYYFVMEYIQGQTLDQILHAQGAFPLHEVFNITRQVGEALAHAHTCEPAVIHRDIKPSNIMIEQGSGRVVVTDFGIAKLIGPQQARYTRTGFTVGSVRYCAREQLRGAHDLDGRTDIFSLGLVMYEMTTGRGFFEGLTDSEIIGKQCYEASENVPLFDRHVPEGLRRVVARAIAKNREDRYQTVTELLTDLGKLRTDQQLTVVREHKHPTGRSRLFLIVATVVTTLLIFLWPSSFPPPVDNQAWKSPARIPERKAVTVEKLETITDTGVEQDQSAPVAKLPPAVESLRPIPAVDTLTLKACETQTFSVQDVAEERRYAWWIDKKRQPQEDKDLTFSTSQPGPHDIQVAAIDNNKARHTWQVIVAPEPPSEEQVYQWLEAYRQALEAKDIQRLQELGSIGSEENAKTLRDTVQARQNYQVHIEQVKAEAHPDKVLLSFTQVERWYDNYSTVVDYVSQSETLVLKDCENAVALQD